MSAALNQNLELLRQGVELLRRLDDETYRGEGTSLQTSYRVGPHLLHCIDNIFPAAPTVQNASAFILTIF